MVSVIELCFILFALFLVQRLFFTRRTPGPLPPGPKGLPLIGNALDVPTKEEWKTYASWGKRWGDLVYLNVFGTPLLVVNSLKVAKELLEKKGSIYSDRMVLAMGGQMVGWDDALGMSQYGEQAHRYRRLLHQVMGTRANVEQWYPLVTTETVRMLQNILKEPMGALEHIRAAVGSTILMITYGYEIKGKDDEFLKIVSQAMDDFARVAVPGQFLVDFIPALKYVPEWVPGAGWQKVGRRMARDYQKFASMGYELVKQQLKLGTALPSFTSVHLSSEEPLTAQRDHDIKLTAVALYGGGSDTTVAALNTFVLAMTMYPEKQKLAQAEIDSVIGNSRLPEFSDKQSLPYVTALCNEVLRWNPVAPLNIPHAARAEDFHRGYYIPARTGVITNLWAMLHDPEQYKDPMSFKPERFIPTDGSAPELDPHEIAFGLGRRICPGILLADASLFLSVATILATFDISKAVENGVEVEPDVEWSSGISYPTPLKYSIKPRNERAASLIAQSDSSRSGKL